jgi:hypothetical protein
VADHDEVAKHSIRRDDDGQIHSCPAGRQLDWLDCIPLDVVSADGHEDPYARLVKVLLRVTELGRALARQQPQVADGRDVRELIDRLYRAAEGHSEDALARRALMNAVAVAATRASVDDDDESICRRVCADRRLPEAMAEILECEPAKVAHAVRLSMRGPGRPRIGEPRGSKWGAMAELAKLVGLPVVDEIAFMQAAKARDAIEILTPLAPHETKTR